MTTLDKQMITREYNLTTDLIARLSMYAMSSPPKVNDELGIEEKQDASTIADLIALALSARRLIVATKATAVAKGAKFPIARGAGVDKSSIWDIMGVIIHNEYFDIVRTDAKKLFYSKKSYEELINEVASFRENKHCDPMIFIKSDKSSATVFELWPFIKTLCDSVLSEVLEICEKEKIYLSEYYKLDI